MKDREAVNKCREEAASVRENALAAREALAEKREEVRVLNFSFFSFLIGLLELFLKNMA